MGDFDILQANDAKAARKVKAKVQTTLKLKKALKKVRQIPTTNLGPMLGPVAPTAGPTTGQLFSAFFGSGAPGLPLGSIGSGAGKIGVTAVRAALRTPGVRQLAERFAGRATTLPRFTTGEIFRGAAIAAGTAATIEGVGQLAERLGPRLGPVQQGPMLGPVQPQRRLPMPLPGTGRAIQTLPGVGGMLPPGTTIVKVWHTGTAQFARLADGRIAVQRKDGTIKVYRPQKHIVIPRNPRVGTLIRADKRLERLVKGLRKVVKSGKR